MRDAANKRCRSKRKKQSTDNVRGNNTNSTNMFFNNLVGSPNKFALAPHTRISLFRIDTHGPYHKGHPDCDDRDNDHSVVDTDLLEAPLDSDFCDPHPGSHHNADVPVADYGLCTHHQHNAPENENDYAIEDVGVEVAVHDDNDHHRDHNRIDDHIDRLAAVHAASWEGVDPGDHLVRPDDHVYPHRYRCVHFADLPRRLVDAPRIPR